MGDRRMKTIREVQDRIHELYKERDQAWKGPEWKVNIIQGEIRSLEWVLGVNQE